MTDEDAIESALSSVEAAARNHVLVRRNGRNFIALPADREGALHALNLYQPQRTKAVLAMMGVRLLAATGLHRIILPRFHGIGGKETLEPEVPRSIVGTAGVMLGSPEHRVKRAILSYRTPTGWEVAKLAFGAGGRAVIDSEHAALHALPRNLPGVPQPLGVHHGPEFSLLRFPYFHGFPPTPAETAQGLDLLASWLLDAPRMPISEFPEWQAIRKTLEATAAGEAACKRLMETSLSPVVRHGDFARWNLLMRKDRSLIALDWEWGHPRGMPGLDLVHLHLQDARLVERLPPVDGLAKVRSILMSSPCSDYLGSTGWSGDPLLPILACLAWKQGAGHQDNSEVLEAGLAMLQ
jgi:hypothetical protein